MRPWEIANYNYPHHAIPLGDGWWRGPEPAQSGIFASLGDLGINSGSLLADGSRSYFPGPELVFDEDYCTTDQAHWIAARIHIARHECKRPLAAPRLMSILNLTADSFSDGGRIDTPEMLLATAKIERDAGASIFDLGAESTRPGAAPIAAANQIELLVPAIELLRPLGLQISIDTRCAAVASACIKAGAHMINDVSALSDPAMASVVAESGCPIVLMHMRGTPATMQQHCNYQHLLGEISDELALRVDYALEQGIQPEQIILDPGIGFAKTADQCLELIGKFSSLRALGFPLLCGPSRKSFLNVPLGERKPHLREHGTAAAAALSAAHGAEFLRLHQGAGNWDAVLTAHSAAVAGIEA